jgi:hypothetical protein
MCEVMIDIETLSTNPNAHILTIAAIKFNRNDCSIPLLEDMETFYQRVDLSTCKNLDFHIDNNTLEWWNKQSKEVYDEAFEKERFPIKDVLQNLSKFCINCDKVWSNGNNFDCVILEHGYRVCDIPVPWKFWNTRDCRTVLDLGKVKLSDIKVQHQHHALYDCYRQIIAVQKSIKNIKNKL